MRVVVVIVSEVVGSGGRLGNTLAVDVLCHVNRGHRGWLGEPVCILVLGILGAQLGRVVVARHEASVQVLKRVWRQDHRGVYKARRIVLTRALLVLECHLLKLKEVFLNLEIRIEVANSLSRRVDDVELKTCVWRHASRLGVCHVLQASVTVAEVGWWRDLVRLVVKFSCV